MKVLEKEAVVRLNTARYVRTERDVLVQAGGMSSNIVEIEFAFQNEHRLYMIMEYCPGGDLSSQIRERMI